MNDFALTTGGNEWTVHDTEEYLRDNPLPADFQWRGVPVVPARGSKRGYGAWLRETPYHQGLFELCHRLLAQHDVLPRRHELAQNDELVRWIHEAVAAQNAQTTLFD